MLLKKIYEPKPKKPCDSEPFYIHKPTNSCNIYICTPKQNIFPKPISDVAKKNNRQERSFHRAEQGPHRAMDKNFLPKSRKRVQSGNFLHCRSTGRWKSCPAGLHQCYGSVTAISHSSLFWIRVLIIWSTWATSGLEWKSWTAPRHCEIWAEYSN